MDQHFFDVEIRCSYAGCSLPLVCQTLLATLLRKDLLNARALYSRMNAEELSTLRPLHRDLALYYCTSNESFETEWLTRFFATERNATVGNAARREERIDFLNRHAKDIDNISRYLLDDVSK